MNLSAEDARKKKLEARAQLLFSNAMTIREKKAQAQAQAKKDEDYGIKRDKFGGIIGETNETPGMVRWVSGNSHYFIKHNTPGRPIFALGFEHRIGGMAYIFDTSIEFDDDEAPDLMDRLAEFQGLPKYTDLLKTVEAVKAMVKEMERMDRDEQRGTLGYLRDALEGNDG